MPYVFLDSSDGQWHVYEDRGPGREVYITDSALAAWNAHIDQGAVFDQLFTMLHNEAFEQEKKREK